MKLIEYSQTVGLFPIVLLQDVGFSWSSMVFVDRETEKFSIVFHNFVEYN